MFDYVSEKNRKKNCFFAKNRICFFSLKKIQKHFSMGDKSLAEGCRKSICVDRKHCKAHKRSKQHQKKNGAKWVVLLVLVLMLVVLPFVSVHSLFPNSIPELRSTSPTHSLFLTLSSSARTLFQHC
jgi:hypothetical protein